MEGILRKASSRISVALVALLSGLLSPVCQATEPPPPARIVSLLPSLTEILFAVGAGEQVVGVTNHCTYPPAAQTRSKVGGYVPRSMNLEQVVGLAPDLVLAAGDLQESSIVALRRLGLRVETVVARDIEGVLQAIHQTGELVGRREEAQRVVEDLKERLAEVRQRVEAIPADQRPGVFYQVWNEPLMTAGGRTFISELIELAGGRNLFQDVDQEYFAVSLEEVVDRDPEVILGARTHSGIEDPESFSSRPGWGGLRAVRDGRIYPVDGDIVSRPGPRLGEALELILRQLHPKVSDSLPPQGPTQ